MKFMVRKAPDNFIRTINDEIGSLLNRHLEDYFPEAIYLKDSEKYSMPVEISDNGKEYVIKAELPGIKKEDLDIDIEENYLKINAKKTEQKTEEEKNYIHSEFNYGEFSRTIQLPEAIDIEKTEAKSENGILEINAPKVSKENEQKKKLIVK